MRMTSMVVNGFGLVSLTIAIAGTNSSASEPPAVSPLRNIAFHFKQFGKGDRAGHQLMSFGALNEKDHGRGPVCRVGRVLNLTHGKVDPDANSPGPIGYF